MTTPSPLEPRVVLAAMVPAPEAVMTGLAPLPDFWKTIGLADVPVAVIKPERAVVKVSVYPAATLNVTPPVPTPWVFRSVMAAAMVAYEPGIVFIPVSWP